MKPQAFDVVGDTFIGYYSQVRGHIREVVTRHNLEPYLDKKGSLEILDIGGGDGRDAIWLAKKGHRVRLIDPSSKMIKEANRNVAKAGLEDRIAIDQGDPAEILRTISGQYDVAISHGVLMYLSGDMVEQHVKLLDRVVKKDGLVSILTKGKNGSLARLMGQRKIAESLKLEKTDRMVNNLGEKTRAVTELSMEKLTRSSSLKLKNWYGVRVATESDYRPIKNVTYRELSALIAIEQRLAIAASTKGMGQMLHFVYQKSVVI